MAATSTKGLKILMQKAGVTPATVTATGVTNAKPAVVTVASTSGMADGQAVKVEGTTMPSLDGQTFVVANMTGTSFELLGSDASGDSAGTGGTFTYFTDADMVSLCASDITVNPETSSPISVATFCDATAQVSGQEAAAGTLDMPLYIDSTNDGYSELIKANDDALSRQFIVVLPGNGYMTFDGVVSTFSWSAFPLEGAVERTATITLSSSPTHRY